MNIAIDVRSIMYGNYTGVGEYTFHLLDHIFKIDKQNQYYLFCNSNKAVNLPDWDYPNVHKVIFRYPNKLLHGSMWLFKRPRFQKMIESEVGVKIDHVFLPNQNFFIPVDDTLLTITVHDLSFIRFPHFFPRFHRFWHKAVNLRRLVNRANQVIAISEHTAQDLQELWQLSTDKITVISPGIDPLFFNHQGHSEEKVKEKYKLPSNYLLYLGTLEPRKNIEMIIKAFEKVADKHKSLHLVLAGGWGWETAGIKQILAQSKFQSKIKLLGYVDRQDKPALYKMAKVFLFPSFYEGYGLPPLEAMSQGCPVITSNTSSLPEVVKDAGYLISPHDLGAFSGAINYLLSNPENLSNRLKKAKLIAEAAQWPESARKVKEILLDQKT